MSEILGFITAVLVLLAALFGLIPPLRNLGPHLDTLKVGESLVSLLTMIRLGLAIFGFGLFLFSFILATRFLFSYGNEYSQRQPAKVITGVTDEEANMVSAARQMNWGANTDAALIKIVDAALAAKRYPLALLAASSLTSSFSKDEQISRALKAMSEETMSNKTTTAKMPQPQ